MLMVSVEFNIFIFSALIAADLGWSIGTFILLLCLMRRWQKKIIQQLLVFLQSKTDLLMLVLLPKPFWSLMGKCFNVLYRCQSPDGGFGGGPGQMPHLACTYAAVNALCTIGTKEAFNVINRWTFVNYILFPIKCVHLISFSFFKPFYCREKLQQFFWSVRQPDGSFIMHQNGEVDVRGAYCALSVSKLTNIYTPDLFEGTAEWIVR